MVRLGANEGASVPKYTSSGIRDFDRFFFTRLFSTVNSGGMLWASIVSSKSSSILEVESVSDSSSISLALRFLPVMEGEWRKSPLSDSRGVRGRVGWYGSKVDVVDAIDDNSLGAKGAGNVVRRQGRCVPESRDAK